MLPPTQFIQRPPVTTGQLERANRRADFLVRMVQGTMGLEAQALPPASLERLKKRAVERLLAR
jgi:hypothetical protein